MIDSIKNNLEDIKAKGLYRNIPPITKSHAKYIIFNGEEKLNCASNDYLGLSHNHEVKEAAAEALKMYGNSSGSSRIVAGNYDLYDKLEYEMAKFKNYECCLIVNTGYTANLLIISTLANSRSIVFTDKLNHASIYDGIKLSGANMARYKHTYHFNVNKGINGNTSEIDIVPDEEIERILKDFASKRVIAASIIFDLFKKSGINLSSQTKLLPSWRQL